MSKSGFTVFIYAFYILGMGLVFLLFPNPVIGWLGFAPTHEIWIRLLGLFAIVVSLYYFQSARHGLIPFLKYPSRGGVY